MVGEQKLQGFPAGIQYLWGVGFNFHAFTDGVYTGRHQASGSFHFHHADAADRLDAQILMITESRNVDTGFFRRLEDRRSFLHLYRLPVDCQMYHHASLPPLRSNRPA